MATKYLYIDDDANAQGIVKVIENNNLNFQAEEPRTWNEQIEFLIEEKNINNYDGLLLDLKLEFTSEEKNNKNKSKLIKFTGADLAQAIRTKIKSDDQIEDLPIFLCSTDIKFISYFDKTSYDLFDKILYKNSDFLNNDDSKVFIEYSNAYKLVNENSELENVIDHIIDSSEELNILKSQFIKCKLPHEYIYLIDRYLLCQNGILIDEKLLAIRLGVDINKSSGWDKFKKDKLSQFSYNGILSKYYSRWWFKDFFDLLKNEYDINLRILNSFERVEGLNKNFKGYHLKPLEKLENQEFTTYWYKCYLTENPLDILDGLKINEIPRYPWIDQNYISNQYLVSEDRDRSKILSLLGPIESEVFNEMD